ncbi:MAG: alpha-L-fucosidase [Bacteroidota bacterium]
MKSTSALLILLLILIAWGCQKIEETEKVISERPELDHHPVPEWFEEAKFGVFVHFGAMGHFGYFKNQFEDQPMWLSREVIERAANEFTLTDVHIREWAQKIKDWGATYAVLTAIQHPGFALWDSDHNEHNITDLSPYGKDLVKTWCESLREEEVKVGLYYNHEDCSDSLLMQILHDSTLQDKTDRPYWKEYLEIRDKRVEELVSNYEDVDLLWFDADWIAKDAEELGTKKLVDMIVEKQPDVVFNNRLRSISHGHYGTPEKYIPVTDLPKPFEVCDNLRNPGLWAYVYDRPGGDDYKLATDVVFTLVEAITQGGNYLLNIGPKPNGEIPERELGIMDTVGTFVNQYAEAIFKSREGLPKNCFGGGSTWKNGSLYLFSTQNGGHIYVNGLRNPLEEITDLATGETLNYTQFGGRPKVKRPEVIKIAIPENSTGLPRVFKVSVEGNELMIQTK